MVSLPIWRRKRHTLCRKSLRVKGWLLMVRSRETMMNLDETLTICVTGSDPIAAALCFYKGLKVYPEPRSLIHIYDNTVPKDVLEILAVMVAQDSQLNVGPIGGKSDTGPASVGSDNVE